MNNWTTATEPARRNDDAASPQLARRTFLYSTTEFLRALTLTLFLASSSIALEIIQEIEEKPAAANQNRFGMNISNLDQWIFNGQSTCAKAGGDLKAKLASEINILATDFDLSQRQQKKLELAGQVDIAHFVRQVEKLYSELPEFQQDQQKMQEFWQKVAPLQQQFAAGIFQGGATFDKVWLQVLNPSQRAAFEESTRNRQRADFERGLGRFVADLDRLIPMSQETRERLLRSLRKEVPNIKPGRANAQQKQLRSQWMNYYIGHHGSQAIQVELVPKVSKEQRKALEELLRRAHQFERNFAMAGLLPDIP